MDKLLLRGEQLTSVASHYSVSEDALGRHRKHMQLVIAKAAALVEQKDVAYGSALMAEIGVIGVKGRKRYVLNVVNAHLDAAATEAEIRRQREVHRPICAVIIEDKANGPAVIQRLRVNVPGVIAINPEGGKTARMFAAAAEWQAGDWYVDRN